MRARPADLRRAWRFVGPGYLVSLTLRIDGENRSLIYLLSTYRARSDSYEARWPDFFRRVCYLRQQRGLTFAMSAALADKN